ncbi:hypothetical protein B9W69_21900, partial [Acinetobacter baumannii]
QSVILKDEENEYRNLGSFLFKINENIKKYFNNKDLQLGHAYFMKNLSIKDKEGEIYILSSKDIFFILFFEIIPMLVEYNNGDDSHLNDIFSEEILSSKKENLIKNIVDFVDN